MKNFWTNCGFINSIKAYYSQKPLQCILVVALLLRLMAAVFARGYGMHDDHFLVIEPSASIAEGYNGNNWLPSSQGVTTPRGHSFFYMGLHYILFVSLNAVKITSPEIQMYIVRILHAVYSLSIVYFGYKIVNKYADRKLALQTAWLLAGFWFMPWLSVRNLVEFQCIPFLLWGTWIYLKKENPSVKTVILSGLVAGVAFSIRFQSLFFLAAFGLALLFMKQFRNAFIWGASALFIMALIQGVIDFSVWGNPFVEFEEYVRYNIEAAGEYLTGSPLMYVYVILGCLLPPVSLFLLFGFFAHWRKYLLLFLPSFAFLLFHSLFLNKQERFILTIIPFVIILGMIGWNEFMSKRTHIKWLKSFIKGSWVFCITLNTILLCIISVHYSKKARVETMLYLSKYENIPSIASGNNVPQLPFYYLNQWVSQYYFEPQTISDLKNDSKIEPGFVILTAAENTQNMLDSLKTCYPTLVFETEIKPNFIDKLLYDINPNNKNEILLIYRNTKYVKELKN